MGKRMNAMRARASPEYCARKQPVRQRRYKQYADTNSMPTRLMESTPRILALYEGDPFAGTRGGDVYAQHLMTRLRKHADVVAVNRETLGLRGTVTGVEYAN